jgi:hypothetical protein
MAAMAFAITACAQVASLVAQLQATDHQVSHVPFCDNGPTNNNPSWISDENVLRDDSGKD